MRTSDRVWFPARTHALARREAAFTLIEVLATTLIAAVLMGGVLAVVSHLTRDGRRMAELARRGGDGDDDRLAELVRADLSRAAVLWPARPDGVVVLDGYGATGPTGATGRAARVTYRVRSTDVGPWLVREEQMLDEPAAATATEAVLPGVASIALTPDSSAGDSLPRSRTAGAPVPPPEAMPAHLRLRVEWSDPGRPPLEQDLVVR